MYLENLNIEKPSSDGRRQRRISNREKIFDAAIKLFSKQGFHSLSIEDICAEAGVSRATFFRIYKTKGGLLVEFNRRLALKVEARLENSDEKGIQKTLIIIAEEITEAFNNASEVLPGIATEFISSLPIINLNEAYPELLELVISAIKVSIHDKELRDIFGSGFMGELALLNIGAALNFWFRNRELELSKILIESVDQWMNGVSLKSNPHAN